MADLLVAGIDSSTQSTTVVVRDAVTGRVVATTRSPHPRTDPPVSEQQPAAWWDALAAAFAALDDEVRAQVAAVSVDAQAHGLVPLDGSLEVLRPAKLWNDTTSAPQARRLVARIGAERWAQAAGSVPVAAFTVTKAAWLHDHEPETWARVRHLLLPHDWLTWRLTGELVTDPGDASGTGYYEPAAGRWRTDLLDLVEERPDWEAHLPRLLGPDEAAGRLTLAAAQALGLRAGIVVGPGAADNQAAAVAMDVRDGDLVVSLGTSGVAYTRAGHPTTDPTGAVNGNADSTGAYLPVVCTLNATRVTDAMARWLGVGLDALGDLALAAPADPARPVLAAFLDGERVPDRPGASGLLGGLRADTSREAVARSAFEGVLAGLLAGADRLTAAGVDVGGRVALTGGGARSAAYRQLLADLSGRDVHVVALDESAAAGAAVQAAAVLAGEPVRAVAERWSPSWDVVARPREAAAAAVRSSYTTLASWTGADTTDPTEAS